MLHLGSGSAKAYEYAQHSELWVEVLLSVLQALLPQHCRVSATNEYIEKYILSNKNSSVVLLQMQPNE